MTQLHQGQTIDSASMKVGSDLGRQLIAQSRRMNNEEVDVSVLADHSIKFQGCQPVTQWVADDYHYNGYSPVQQKYLARFTLCPSEKCTENGCASSETGEYVVDLTTYTKTLLKAAGYASQYENKGGNQGNGNNIANYYQDDYVEDYGYDGNVPFSPVDHVSCGYYNNGGGANNVTFSGYISAYCVNHKAIKFGVFSDSTCSQTMNGGLNGFRNGEGYDLPYSYETLVSSSDECTSCASDGNGGNSISTICQTLYTYSGKCETNLMAMEYPNESACEYISAMSGIRGNKSTFQGARAQSSIAASIAIQVLGGAALCLAVYVWFLARKFNRAKNNLRH